MSGEMAAASGMTATYISRMLPAQRASAGRDAAELPFYRGDQFLRQWCVMQWRAHRLAVVHGPPEKIDQRLCLDRIVLLLIDQNPRQAADRVRRVAGRVRNRNTQILRHVLERSG